MRVFQVAAILTLTNHTRHSHNFPCCYFRPPKNEFEQTCDAQLITFWEHNERNWGLEGPLDIAKFKRVNREDEGLANFITFK